VPAPRLRIAVIDDDPLAEVDGSVRAQFRQLVDFLRRSGVTVGEAERPVDSTEAWQTYVPLVRSAVSAHLSEDEYAQARAHAAAQPPGSTEFPAMHWQGLTLAHRDWVMLDEVRSRLRRQWAEFFERWDLLICPVATTPAFPQNQQGFRWQRMVRVNGREQPSTTSLFWAGYTNLCGLPATAGSVRRGPADRRAGLRPGLRRPGVPALRALAGVRVPRVPAAADGGLKCTVLTIGPLRWLPPPKTACRPAQPLSSLFTRSAVLAAPTLRISRAR
jgi:hypothetical protein